MPIWRNASTVDGAMFISLKGFPSVKLTGDFTAVSSSIGFSVLHAARACHWTHAYYGLVLLAGHHIDYSVCHRIVLLTFLLGILLTHAADLMVAFGST